MKRKRVWIPILILLGLIISGFWVMYHYSIGFTVGRCVVADNGSYLYVKDNSPVRMSNRTSNDDMFSGLEMGDKIFVVHNGVNESYPGQTGVYFCYKLESGTIEDISEGVIDELTELGWLQKEVVLENTKTIEYNCENVRMALDLPESWEYVIDEHSEETQSYGISIWPKGNSEGKLSLQCHASFGVCGTGLTEEETTIAGMNARMGIYDDSAVWDFIIFTDFQNDFVILNDVTVGWWMEYGSEAMAILNTLRIEEK